MFLNKYYVLFSAFTLLLAGCSSNYADETDDGKPTMLELHQSHVSGLYGNKIELAREKFTDGIDPQRSDFHSDLRLPNPELEMVVFPRKNADGSIQPQYVLKFSMYEKVHYQLGVVSE